MIFSSDRDFTLWPKPGTELTIDLDATSLTLPVVGGSGVFAKATNCQSSFLKCALCYMITHPKHR